MWSAVKSGDGWLAMSHDEVVTDEVAASEVPADQLAAVPDEVDSSETLYRRVRNGTCKFVEGHWKCSENAFGDLDKEPSVDRAKCCGNDPAYTRLEAADAVASLSARDVRNINTVVQRTGATGATISHRYKIDVRPDPIKDEPGTRDNPAHAKIHADEALTNGPFKRLREELADMAVVVLEPAQD